MNLRVIQTLKYIEIDHKNVEMGKKTAFIRHK